MVVPVHPITMEFETDPVENERARQQHERFRRNLDWVDAHGSEVFAHRGKYVCIAGQEIFVGDSVEEVLDKAKAAHPEDNGFYLRYIQKEKAEWVYAF